MIPENNKTLNTKSLLFSQVIYGRHFSRPHTLRFYPILNTSNSPESTILYPAPLASYRFTIENYAAVVRASPNYDAISIIYESFNINPYNRTLFDVRSRTISGTRIDQTGCGVVPGDNDGTTIAWNAGDGVAVSFFMMNLNSSEALILNISL